MSKEKNNLGIFLMNAVSSLVIGAGVGAVFYAGFVSSINTLIIITLILGIVGIALLLFSIFFNNKLCNYINSTSLVPSSVGAIIASSFALSLTNLSTLAITVGILIGAVAFFLSLTIISMISVLICIFCNNNCYYKDC